MASFSRICLGLAAFATVSAAAPLATGTPATSPGLVRVIPDVAYLASNRTEKLDVYLPVNSRPAAPCPAVVWIHGRNGSKSSNFGSTACETLAAAGYVCVSIDHGPDTAHIENVLDGKNAVRFLRVHAAAYRVDPARIAVFGESAGGTYALMVGFTPGNPRFEPSGPYPGISSAVRAVVDFYGPVGPRTSLDVLSYVTAAAPPVLIVHGADDATVPCGQSFELDRALTANGVPHHFILLPGVGHTFSLTTTRDGKPLPEDLRPVVLTFLRESLGVR